MKKTLALFLAICATVITLHAFRIYQASGIKGTISPVEATVTNVWAIGATDSVKVVPVQGTFSLNVKAGTYKLIVDAAEPYKDAVLERVEVREGQITDVGEIKLPQ